MKTIDLNFNVKDLDGVDMINGHAGKIVATALVFQTKGDAVKFLDWGLKLNNKEVLSLDDSDYSTLKDFIKNNETLPVITRAQVLKAFEL